jgi:hypothetical protein
MKDFSPSCRDLVLSETQEHEGIERAETPTPRLGSHVRVSPLALDASGLVERSLITFHVRFSRCPRHGYHWMDGGLALDPPLVLLTLPVPQR